LMQHSTPFVQIAIPLPLDYPLSYLWPDSLLTAPSIGRRVLVPLGKRKVAGYVVQTDGQDLSGRDKKQRAFTCREVISLLDDDPLFSTGELQFYQWISRYYLVSLGEVLRTALPVSMHQRSYKAVRILPQGLLAFKKGVFLTSQELEILNLLDLHGKMPLKQLRQKTGRSIDRWIQSLEEKGFVEKCQIIKNKKGEKNRGDAVIDTALSRTDPSFEQCVSILPSKQARILRALFQGGPLSEKEVESEIPGSKKALKTLKEKGFIQYNYPEEGFPSVAPPRLISNPSPKTDP